MSNAVATWNSLLERASREGVQSLSHTEQVVYRVNAALCDLENGGMSGFLYNRSPHEECSEWNELRNVVQALAEVGATKLATALASLTPLLERKTSPTQDTWAAVLAQIEDDPALVEADAIATEQSSQLWTLLEDFTNTKVV